MSVIRNSPTVVIDSEAMQGTDLQAMLNLAREELLFVVCLSSCSFFFFCVCVGVGGGGVWGLTLEL